MEKIERMEMIFKGRERQRTCGQEDMVTQVKENPKS